MKVLLRRNIRKLGQIGEVVEVRDGYARNYLIPHGLAAAPTEGNLKAIQAERQAYLAEQAKQRSGMEQRAKSLEGKEFTISARANQEGHLYGSVGPAQVAAAVSGDGFPVDAENIVLDEPIRRLDKYEVPVEFAEDVRANITVWVVPLRELEQGADQAGPPARDDASEPSEVQEAPSQGAADHGDQDRQPEGPDTH